MNILKESKEELPISFLTTRLSDCWNRVGELKSEIEAIHKEFKGTGKIEEILQDLLDAELVCAGRIQAALDSKNYVEFPEDESKEVKESLKEDTNINITISTPDESAVKAAEPIIAAIAQPAQVDADIEAEIEAETEEDDAIRMAMDENAANTIDESDFFCEFDEPIGKKLTDKEVYGE